VTEPKGSPHPRTISIQPRPRSPLQLIDMMIAIKHFDGVDWGAKDSRGKKITQIIVGEAIGQSQSFKIVPKSEKTMQYRTYVTMNPPTLGLAYIDDDGKLRITKSGLQAANEKDLEMLFTRQLIKWQYPSNSHGGSGGKGRNSFPLRDKWQYHPFVSVIMICIRLEKLTGNSDDGYLSKEEVATFILTMYADKQVNEISDEILSLRNKCATKKANEKKILRRKKHLEKLNEVYRDDIDKGNFKIRQRETNSVNEFLETKINNTNDYADTIIRYCRFTGIFRYSERVKNLAFNPHQKWKAELIASTPNFLKINSDIDDKKKFYDWFGDTNTPKLPWESEIGYKKEILENLKQSLNHLNLVCKKKFELLSLIKNEYNSYVVDLKNIIHSISDKISANIIDNLPDDLNSNKMDQLSDIATRSRVLLQHTGKIYQMQQFTRTNEINETLNMFQYVIENKKWDDPFIPVNLLLEWATYRSLAALNATIPDEFGPILNADGSAPIFTAGGNRPDLVADFKDFVLVIESTVSSGARQYNTETEPVARHIAEIQKLYPDKKVYSIFLARDISPHVVEYFLIYYAFHKHPTSDKHLLIAPMNIDTFKNLFKTLTSDVSNAEKKIKLFFEDIESQRLKLECKNCSTSKMEVDLFKKIISQSLKKHLE
jgi:hypothetical protein